MTLTGIRIHAVQPGSLSDELGIKAGDYLVSVNGIRPRDILEYKEIISVPEVQIQISTADGHRELTARKDPHAELGLIFDSSIFDRLKTCRNQCSFCFVHQLPRGLRKSLYLRDDDYRLSFLEGSFITLTNLTEADFERIIASRLSPLYISVHACDPQLRAELMGNPRAATIMADLSRLAAGGIKFHLQLVLIPGLNDGSQLVNSLEQLAELGESCLSIAVVPVGLTGFRTSLTALSSFDALSARLVLDTVHSWQSKFWAQRGQRILYAADEFYWLAGYPIPTTAEYEDYPQLENGVGLTRLFWDTFLAHYRPGAINEKYLLVTGVSGARVLQYLVLGFNPQLQSQVKIVSVPNTLFGGAVTVTGLLGGRDIIRTLLNWRKLGYNNNWKVIIPEIILNRDRLTLDNLTIEDIAQSTDFTIKTVAPDGRQLAKLLSQPKKTKYTRWLNE